MRWTLLLGLVLFASNAFTSDKFPLGLNGFYERISADSSIKDSVTCPPFTIVKILMPDNDTVVADYSYLEKKSDDPKHASRYQIYGEQFDSTSVRDGNWSQYSLMKLDKDDSNLLTIKFGGVVNKILDVAGECKYKRL